MNQEQNNNTTRFFQKNRRTILSWAVTIVIAVGIAVFLNGVIIVNAYVPSGSMESTIMTGSRMIGLRMSYWGNDSERGDIIIFKYPDNPSQNYVKRVIGLPGDTLEIINGVTYVNGAELEETYLKETPIENDYGPYEVPEECYFVMGDNRNNSNDSRKWDNTFVSRDAVLGKALVCYWPLGRIGVLK